MGKWKYDEKGVDIQFKGTVATDGAAANLRILLFTNKQADYEQWQAVWESPISLQRENEDWQFDISALLNLEPGLYYYLFENIEEEAIVKAGKVEVT